jgi:ligand-binding SRPBCC domain-containing protein
MPRAWCTELWLPRPASDLFAFLSDASNLDSLTPPWLRIRILTPGPIAMGPGTLIDYELRLHGLPLRWRTEITGWEPPHRFTERQARGPFSSWEQEHHFAARGGGTLVQERIEYRVLGGALIDGLLVAPEMARIYSFRAVCLEKLFGRDAGSSDGHERGAS